MLPPPNRSETRQRFQIGQRTRCCRISIQNLLVQRAKFLRVDRKKDGPYNNCEPRGRKTANRQKAEEESWCIDLTQSEKGFTHQVLLQYIASPVGQFVNSTQRANLLAREHTSSRVRISSPHRLQGYPHEAFLISPVDNQA